MVGVWDGSGLGDGSNEPLFMVFPASRTAGALGAASLYFCFFPDSMGGGVGVGSAVKWLAAARALALGGNNVGSS